VVGSTDLTEDDLRTADGEVVDRQNPVVQLIKLHAFVENHRWEKVAEYVGRASGKGTSRPEFDKMLGAAFRHEFDIILIVRIDRIMRSLKNLHDVLENLKEYKVKLMATDQVTGRVDHKSIGGVRDDTSYTLVDFTLMECTSIR
jgi:DNA invertase Pin-like site-specific DNA recombinase